MNAFKKTMLIIGFLAAGSWSHAITFNLESSAATMVGGNTTSPFYGVNGSGVEANGTIAKDWFSSTVGGNANSGFWVNISFGPNPQPVLSSAFLKASNAYLFWNSADLTGFNAGLYDSITLWNSGANGLKNQNGKFHETSHAGVTGTPGVRVPDGGTTAALLGTALLALGSIVRRRSGA